MNTKLRIIAVIALLLNWPAIAYADLDFLGDLSDKLSHELIFSLLLGIYLLSVVYMRLSKQMTELTKKVVIATIVLLMGLLTMYTRTDWLNHTVAAIFAFVIFSVPAVLSASLLSVFVVGAVENKGADRRPKNLALFFLVLLGILFMMLYCRKGI